MSRPQRPFLRLNRRHFRLFVRCGYLDLSGDPDVRYLYLWAADRPLAGYSAGAGAQRGGNVW